MSAKHQGRTAVVFFDDMYGPQRMVGVEGFGRKLTNEALERVFIAASRQPHALDVMGEVEFRVVASEDTGWRILDLLAITSVAQQPLSDLFLDLVKLY